MPDKYVVSTARTTSRRYIRIQGKGVTVSRELKALAFGTVTLATTVVFSESFSEIPPAAIPSPVTYVPESGLGTSTRISKQQFLVPTPTSHPVSLEPLLPVASSPTIDETHSETSVTDVEKSQNQEDSLEIKINPIPGVEIKYLKDISGQNAWKLFGVLLFIYWVPTIYKKILLKKEKTTQNQKLQKLEVKLEKVLHEMEKIKQVNSKGFSEGTDFVVLIHHKETSYSVLRTTAGKIQSITRSARMETNNISPELNRAVDKLYTAVTASTISGDIVMERLRHVILVIKDLGIE